MLDDSQFDPNSSSSVEETEEPRVTIKQVIDQFKEWAGGNTTKQGDLWEHLIIICLKKDRDFQKQFKNIRKPTKDIGIDIFAEHRVTGAIWAFQAKFYTEGNVPKKEIAIFVAAAEEYDHRVVVSNSPLTKEAEWILFKGPPGRGRLWRPKIFEGRSLKLEIFLDPDFFEKESREEHSRYYKRKELRPHQTEAVADVLEGFKTSDRGRMIMACGTGKTFTALKLAEEMVPEGGTILFLAPSLSLVSQTLHEWQNEASADLYGVAVCSDVQVRKPPSANKDEENLRLRLNELPFLVTTNEDALVEWFRARAASTQGGISVVYSTYQSLEAVSEAQKKGKLPDFDLVICDEAHRTASARKKGKPKKEATPKDGKPEKSKREAHFSLIHDADFIRAKKRLYMTATPKVYSSKVMAQAKVEDIIVCSMDDTTLYGPEFHRLGFGSAVKAELLSDYRVMILIVKESSVNERYRLEKQGRNSNSSDDGVEKVAMDNEARIVGCLNGLCKYRLDEDDTSPIQIIEHLDSTPDISADTKPIEPMRRALTFLNTIKDSKNFIDDLGSIEKFAPEFNGVFKVVGEHVDGKMSAGDRSEALDRLREATEDKDPPECRIISNVRCLSEGVDVPALDAVIFLAPRKSKIDIVQSVGRVMRVAPGKKYGYIILPVVVPEEASSDEEIREALDDNKRFDHIWEVLEALRAHDERFDIRIEQLALQLRGEETEKETDSKKKKRKKGDPPEQDRLFGRWQKGIRAKIVERVGTRWYWRIWAAQVGEDARATADKIQSLLKSSKEVRAQFSEFLTELQATLNSSVGERAAVEMLAQHLVARPVFDALFKDYTFSKDNPVSQAMQKMLDNLSKQHGFEQYNDELNRFYDNVKWRIEGINSAAGRQQLILDIYNHFFNEVFKKTAKRLGIVYTPPKIVDFILHSVDYIAQKELEKSLADEGVHILDPFTGTGTFISRLIQSGLIPKEALERKFGAANGADDSYEFHAIEIVLLAYYIAAINIEEAYHNEVKDNDEDEYHPFRGILFGDTFQIADEMAQKEKEQQALIKGVLSAENNRRAEIQKQLPIRVIVGNPPYSMKQKSANDANQNLKYEHLEERIKATYAAHGTSGLKQSLYDSCNLALRFASDRIGNKPEDEGVIGFVTNGYFLDSNSAVGLRHCLLEEFSHVYCFDLRGNSRLSRKSVKKEGEGVFGNKSRVPVVILILVKKAGHKPPGTLHYYDIGDSLTGKAKLKRIGDLKSIEHISWKEVEPDDYDDWINQRSETLNQFIPLGIKETKGKADTKSIFTNYSMGIASSRDPWVYNFSREKVEHNMQSTIKEYNRHIPIMKAMIAEYKQHVQEGQKNSNLKTKGPKNPKYPKNWDKRISTDSTQIKWSQTLQDKLVKGKRLEWQPKRMALSHFRPFAKRHFYYEPGCLHRPYQQERLFPTPRAKNKVICVSGLGTRPDFSAIMVDSVPSNVLLEAGQCFPLYTWEKGQEKGMFPSKSGRQENITDYALALFRQEYSDMTITEEDIFYYVYGILHSPEYKRRFSQDLKKIFVRIPLALTADYFVQFRDAGIKLADLHLNYETAPLYNNLSLALDKAPKYAKDETNFDYYRVEKMKFGEKLRHGKFVEDWSEEIKYNKDITLRNIPVKAYEYQINDYAAIEWIMRQYQVKKDKSSGIVNDPNDCAREHENPRYILDLLLRVITMSLDTMEIINSLPKKDSFQGEVEVSGPPQLFPPPRKDGA